MLNDAKRIAELSAGVGIALGYLERMSQSKLRDPESHHRVLNQLREVLDGKPDVDVVTAILESAEVTCARAIKVVESKMGKISDEERKKDYREMADQIRAIFPKTKAVNE